MALYMKCSNCDHWSRWITDGEISHWGACEMKAPRAYVRDGVRYMTSTFTRDHEICKKWDPRMDDPCIAGRWTEVMQEVEELCRRSER